MPQSPSHPFGLRPIPFILILLFSGFTLVAPVHENPALKTSFVTISTVLAAWIASLWFVRRQTGIPLSVEFVPVPSHYVQACVQFCILAYWGWFAREVGWQAPLILAQVVYLYILEALLSWSRGRTWRLGFGPLPIVFSTNLLLWFKADVFYYQFAMLTLGALGKQFITWEREGKRTHIFNPSAFGQFIVAIALIVTGTTNELTWGKQIAASFETPHMLVVIFLGGLVVQSLFRVTLMTVAAAITLCLVNIIYTRTYGTYFFVNVNVAAPIFLGIHLLITDPATSPRTNVGQVVFGTFYALAYCALFRMLDIYEVPTFWDKLLPVPILNLAVPALDRLARANVIGKLNNAWQSALSLPRLNAVHMACWIALFAFIWGIGFVDAEHPGNSIPFWQKALADGKPHASHSLVMAIGTQAEALNSGPAYNELGLLCMEGKLVKQNRPAAAKYFAKACELGDLNGCANVAGQFLFLHERRSDDDVNLAMTQLEKNCGVGSDWKSCLLSAIAYESGRGRPKNAERAMEFFIRCGNENLYAAKGLARLSLTTAVRPKELLPAAARLRTAAETGDAEAAWYLAFLHYGGIGVTRDEALARSFLETACIRGLAEACNASKSASPPAFSKPPMIVPDWSTAFPKN
ncbi:MAG: SEL1-like repeat protein [Planctomycetes bacterium]|nr:SEL1-like repeat protein [Planctomycetota bacterium]